MINTHITAATMRFALLGETLDHTWSPQIHNTLFDLRAVPAIYLPLPVPAQALASAIDVLRHSFDGFNVTIPYKQAVLPYLDELDALSSACGAVNTVRVAADGSLSGHNTDGPGFLQALRDAFIDASNCDVVVLGNGGTARMVAYTLLSRGCHVTLAARDTEGAQTLVRDLSAVQKDGGTRLRVIRLSELAQSCDLLVNCTPVGMYPHAAESPIPRAQIARCGAIFDAIYHPVQTQLLDMADAEGVKTCSGLRMLFYQAVEAQRIWLGRIPDARKLRTARQEIESMCRTE